MIGDLIADKGDVIVAISRTLPREEVVDFTLPLLLDRCDSYLRYFHCIRSIRIYNGTIDIA